MRIQIGGFRRALLLRNGLSMRGFTETMNPAMMEEGDRSAEAERMKLPVLFDDRGSRS